MFALPFFIMGVVAPPRPPTPLWSITALDGVPSICLTNYLGLYVIYIYIYYRFIVRFPIGLDLDTTVCSIHSFISRNNWIATYLQCLILRVNQDSTTAWIMDIV